MADNVKKAFEGIGEFFGGIWNNLTSGAEWAGKELKNGFEWAINGIKGFFEGLGTKVQEIFEQIGNGIKWAINGIIWTVNQVIAGINSVVGWTGIKINQIGYLAKGTNSAQKGLYLVGEAGPELVQFNGGERVLNNRNTNKALSEIGSNSGNTFNVTFNNLQDTTAFAMMNQLKQYNRQMAINSII
jgi:phage-related protein